MCDVTIAKLRAEARRALTVGGPLHSTRPSRVRLGSIGGALVVGTSERTSSHETSFNDDAIAILRVSLPVSLMRTFRRARLNSAASTQRTHRHSSGRSAGFRARTGKSNPVPS